MLFLMPDVRKIDNSFFTVSFVRLVIHRQSPHICLRSKCLDPSQNNLEGFVIMKSSGDNWANISETICP